MAAMHVVVTGASGNVGTSLLEVLSADPEVRRITGIARRITRKMPFSNVDWVSADVASTPLRPLFAGADVREMPLGKPLVSGGLPGTPEADFFETLVERYEYSWPKPRVIVLSFPHNPTTTCVDLDFMQKVVDFAREREVVVVHDFAYADLGFDGYEPPSILQAEGAKEVAVELYSMTKSFSMAGWRVAFMAGNPEVIAALAKLKSYLDYGTFQPIQIAATVTMNEAPDYPKEVRECYQGRRDALIDGLGRIGWEIERPRGTMFAWAPIPEPYRELGSIEFASMLVREANVATSPGVGFGPGGDGHVRFALIENEQRITQGMRNLKKALTKLG